MTTTALVTADQLLHMPSDGCRHELVAGELRSMTLAGWRHGQVGGRLLGLMATMIGPSRVGEIFSAETGFLLSRDPDTVRAPDIAFIRKDRLPPALPEDSFWPGPPDLAVEVVSPRDTYREVDKEVKAWLDAGAMMVWVVNPNGRSISVYRSATDIKILTENDQLTGEDVLPGFACRVGDIFTNP